MPRRLSAYEAGTRAYAALEESAPLTRIEWADRAGLTRSQLTRGFAWCDDQFEFGIPIISLRVGGQWVYTLARNERDAREYMVRKGFVHYAS